MFYAIKSQNIETGETTYTISKNVPTHYVTKQEIPSGILRVTGNMVFYSLQFSSKKDFRDYLRKNQLTYDINKRIWSNQNTINWESLFDKGWDFYFKESKTKTLSQFFVYLFDISNDKICNDYSDDVVNWWYKKGDVKNDSEVVQ